MTFNYIKALIADPKNKGVQMWVSLPLAEDAEDEILAFFNEEENSPLKRFYAVDEELTEAEIDELLKEPKFTDVDELEVIAIDSDTDDYEVDEAFDEAEDCGFNLSDISQMAEIVEKWDSWETALFCAVHSDEYRFQIQEFEPSRYDFYEGQTKEEVAENYYFDEMYPDFPDELKEYLDMASWAEDEMRYDWTETKYGTYRYR